MENNNKLNQLVELDDGMKAHLIKKNESLLEQKKIALEMQKLAMEKDLAEFKQNFHTNQSNSRIRILINFLI